MPDEQAHADGAEGIERAKVWLEATMRANVPFVAPTAGQKLRFSWVDGSQFSFDMKGNFVSGPVDGQQFISEVKNYTDASDLGTHFDQFLAQCYRLVAADPGKVDEFDRFLWVSWSPFRATSWGDLHGSESVARAVNKWRGKAVAAGTELDRGLCELVASRTWVVVMSDAVETLVPTALQKAHAAVGSAGQVGGS
jgi:hypothetical protein